MKENYLKKTKSVAFSIAFCLFALTIVVSCRYPYSPEPEDALILSNRNNSEGSVNVVAINGTAQICNPSISLDTINFPGCMLWLNFSGDLPVNVPDSLKAYSEKRSLQHDRLSIVDSENTLRWYMKREEFGADEREELQDPEWAAHPAYITCLVSADAQKKWGCYVIHPVSRNKLQICSEGLWQTSTPHVWVAPEAQSSNAPAEVHYLKNGFADSAAVHEFFGTDEVKVVAGIPENGVLSLYYIDYSTEDRKLIPLKRPSGKDGWQCESPLISPDGHWVVYNVYKRTDDYETYIQKLQPEAPPILFKDGVSDPHWWRHPEDPSLLYVVYQEVPGDNLVYGDFTKKEYLQSGELGSTKRQMVRLFFGASSNAASFLRIGFEETIVSLPMKGGLSPDGKFLCTGYDRAFIVELP